LKIPKEFPIVTVALAAANVVIFMLFPVPGTLEAAVQGLAGTIYLLVFGAILERKVGSVKTLAVALLAGFAAAALSFALALGVPYVAFGAFAATSGVVGACLFTCSSDEIPLALAFLLIFPGIAYFVFLGPQATLGTLGGYIFAAFGIPIVLFVLIPSITVVLLPFLVMWAVLQLGTGLYWMSAPILAGAVLAPLLGLIVGAVVSFLFLREKEKLAPKTPTAR
jgi:membrane associated rhomboid family serine protease